MEFIILKHAPHFVTIQEQHLDVFGCFKMLGRHFLYAYGKICVTIVCARSSIRTYGHQFAPFASCVTCFLSLIHISTWVSLHNGGGVGWGEVINGGFGMVIDGSEDSDRHIREMLFWDVNNGIARRAWARNEGSIHSIEREMMRSQGLQVTMPSLVDDDIINKYAN